MQPTPITQYALYYSYSDVPFDNCDADWTHYGTFHGLREAKDEMEADRICGSAVFYIIMEEITTRKVIHSDVWDD